MLTILTFPPLLCCSHAQLLLWQRRLSCYIQCCSFAGSSVMFVLLMWHCTRTAIHKTVSVVLLLGNMQFKQEKNSDQAVMPDDTGNWWCLCLFNHLFPWTHV